RRNWILVSSTDAGFIKGFLLGACRHLSLVQSMVEFEGKAIQYKLQYLENLRKDISTQPAILHPRWVASALVLAFNEILLGNISMASQHIKGAADIVQAAGGPQALGLSRFCFVSCPAVYSTTAFWADVSFLLLTQIL
ncbi:hypothetical protein FOC4_g10001693, partial [Fusarium odoratissimum]